MNLTQFSRSFGGRCQRLFLAATSGLLLVLPGQGAVVTVTNSTLIALPDGFSDSVPFPSTIYNSMDGTIQKVTVSLHGLTENSPGEIQILLVGPGDQPQSLVLMSASGGQNAITNYTVVFDDNAAAPMSGAKISPETPYQPTGGTAFYDLPPGQTITTNKLAGFNGTQMQGTWSLYEYYADFSTLGDGAISNGWSLTFTYATPTAPQLILPTVTNGQFTVTLTNCQVGAHYAIDSTPDISTTNWTPIVTNVATTNSLVFTDTNAPGLLLFYRARTAFTVAP